MRKLCFLVVALSLASATATSAIADTAPAKQTKSHEQVEVIGFHPVSRGHWMYEAAGVLSTTGIFDANVASRVKGAKLLSRYEFALWIGEVLGTKRAYRSDDRKALEAVIDEKFPREAVEADVDKTTLISRPPGSPTKAECFDLLQALTDEFQAELQVLGVRYHFVTEAEMKYEMETKNRRKSSSAQQKK